MTTVTTPLNPAMLDDDPGRTSEQNATYREQVVRIWDAYTLLVMEGVISCNPDNDEE